MTSAISRIRAVCIAALILCAGLFPAAAQQSPEASGAQAIAADAPAAEAAAEEVPAEDVDRGQVTNLPVPRFVSMKAREGNVRRGPSLSHRIDWVYKRKDMPLEITAEYGHWRRVRDRDGIGGWVHYSLLSGVRTVLIESERATLYSKPDPRTQVNAYLERGVVARLEECLPDWCEVRAGSYRGWLLKSEVWGVGADELRD